MTRTNTSPSPPSTHLNADFSLTIALSYVAMDPRFAQSFPVCVMPNALQAHLTDPRQGMLARIAEEGPRTDAYYQPPPPAQPVYHHQQHQHPHQIPLQQQPQPQQQEIPQPQSREVSDAEPRTEDPTPNPSKRQRMSHTCETCGTSYTEKRALARHRHTDQHRQRLGLPLEKKHVCSFCGTQFSRRHDRMRHENERHGGAKQSPSEQSKSPPGRPTPPPQQPSELENFYQTHGRTPTPDNEDIGSVPTVETIMEDPMLSDAPHTNHFYTDSSTPESVTSQPYSRQRYNSAPFTPESMSSSAILGPIQEYPSSFDIGQFSSPNQASMTDDTPSDDGNASSNHDSAVDIMDPSRKTSTTSMDYISNLVPAPPLQRSRSFELPSLFPKKTSLISRKGKVTAVGRSAADWPMFCGVCGDPFEDKQEDLLVHLRKHMDDFKSNHWCSECQLGFVQAEDLARHRSSAAGGDCGFNFPHHRPCTGHHPPLKDDPWAAMSDRDSFHLSVRLRHWEQSQLRAYLSQINDLVAAKTRRGSVVSFDYLPNSRPASIMSSSLSVITYDTVPADRNANGDMDVGGLAGRFKRLTFSRQKTPHASWDPATRSGERDTSNKSTIANTQVNKHLRKAIYRCDLGRVEKLLSQGADPMVLQGDDAMLTIMALWDRASAQALIVQHTIGQQCYGARCGCALSRPTVSTDPELIRALLDHGAEANDPGGLCGYPLHTAAYMGKIDIVRILLEYNARIDSMAGKYGSALCCAAARADMPGNVDVVRLLIEKGARLHPAGKEGDAIFLARKRRNEWSSGIPGADAMNPEASARINCCSRILEILGAE